MLTYEAPVHEVNIEKVKEKDKDGNIIFDNICTFDATNDCGFEMKDEDGNVVRIDNKDSYTFFGLNPERTLHPATERQASFLTLANSLAVQPDNLLQSCYFSQSPYSGGFFTTYSPISYLYSMLHLMGYNYDGSTTLPFDVVAELQERGRIGEIPTEMIKTAARNIERRKHPEMSEEEFSTHMSQIEERIDNSIYRRNQFYDSNNPAVILLNKTDGSIIDVNTYSNVIPEHEHIDIDAIDMGPVYYQELDTIQTGEFYGESDKIEEENNIPEVSIGDIDDNQDEEEIEENNIPEKTPNVPIREIDEEEETTEQENTLICPNN